MPSLSDFATDWNQDQLRVRPMWWRLTKKALRNPRFARKILTA